MRVRNQIKASNAVLLREVEVARCQVRGRYPSQRDRIVRVVGYDRVCSDLLGIGHRRRVIRNQGRIKVQHVMRRVEVRDGVVTETHIECEGVLALSDRPDVARRRDKLVIPVSDDDGIVCPPRTPCRCRCQG